MEAAPGGITLEKASAWRRAGINRVSLGVQSFNTRDWRERAASTRRRSSSASRHSACDGHR